MNSKLSSADMEKLSGKKIYFGHQSVGYNIMNGVVNITDTNFKVTEGIPDDKSNSGFYHSRIGKNGNPDGKVDDFVSKMKNGTGKNVNIAFFKFCYIDFSHETDIDHLFQHYRDSMAMLKKEFPSVQFIYCTVPLVCDEGWLKTSIKSLLGKNNERLNNIKRNKFNQLIHNEYDNKELIFDIAKFESNDFNSYFVENNSKIYTLNREFTSDGAHLNKKGSEIVARGLLELLLNKKK